MGEDVLVIGAGPAGIASAYFLKQAGISYRVVDHAPGIASTWSGLYPSLRLNTTRFYSHLPGKRFPLHYGIFPSGRQYHHYLESYVAAYDLNLQFSVHVRRITMEADGWRVNFADHSEWFPAVISATGRFGSPWLPEIPGLNQFQGRWLHSHDYTDPTPYAGQRVMIVGNGPSGLDISIELGKQNAPACPALLSMRTGLILKPRYPLGLPKHLWMMLCEHLPEQLSQPLEKWTESVQFNPRRLKQLGIRVPDPGQMSSAASTRGPELIHAVRAGLVRCVPGLMRLEPHCAILEDGSAYEIDTLILATGYRPVLYHYFSYPVETDDNDWPRRDLSQHPNGREVLGYPGLYLVGVFYKGKGAMYNFSVEAKIAVEQIQKRLQTREVSTEA